MDDEMLLPSLDESSLKKRKCSRSLENILGSSSESSDLGFFLGFIKDLLESLMTLTGDYTPSNESESLEPLRSYSSSLSSDSSL